MIEIDISCPSFVSTLKFTSLPYISLIELTDVNFSSKIFHWLFENNETDQGDCLTVFGYF